MLLDRAEDAEPVGDLVADEARVRRADLGVVVVVVALAVAGCSRSATPGSCSRGYLLTRSTTWLLTSAGNQRVRSRHVGEVADVGRRRGLDLDRAGAAGRRRPRPRGPGRRTSGSGPGRRAGGSRRRRPGRSSRAPSGRSRRPRPAASQPRGPREAAAPCPRTSIVSPLDEVADDGDRLLERRHRRRRLAEDAPRGVAAADAEVHPAAAQLVERRQRRRGHARLARRRVRDAGARAAAARCAWAMSVSSGYGSRHRTCESNSQP